MSDRDIAATERYIRESMIALESARDSAAQQAGDLAELAHAVESAHSDLAEIMMGVAATAYGLDKPIAAVRLRLEHVREKLSRLGLERASSCEALTRLVGPPRTSARATNENDDTAVLPLDDVARMNAEDRD